MTNSHRHCDHEATKAARAACRKLRAQGIDTTLGLADLAANRLARKYTDHDRTCFWHASMSYIENWDLSQREDPTAEWCKGEPSVELIMEYAVDGVRAYCNCNY